MNSKLQKMIIFEGMKCESLMQSSIITTINKATNPDEYASCAIMMSKSNPWITLEMGFDQCILAFEGKSKEVYVMSDNNQIVGFVILQMDGSFKGYIQTICISEEFRGKGLGKKLLKFCEERIFKISPNIFICVSSFNTGALQLYTNFGFKIVGELTDFVKDGFTELLLLKSIGPIIGYSSQE